MTSSEVSILIAVLGLLVGVVNLVLNYLINNKVSNLKQEYLYKERMPSYIEQLEEQIKLINPLLTEMDKNSNKIISHLTHINEIISGSIKKLSNNNIFNDADTHFLNMLAAINNKKIITEVEYKKIYADKNFFGKMGMSDSYITNKGVNQLVNKINGLILRWKNDFKDYEISLKL